MQKSHMVSCLYASQQPISESSHLFPAHKMSYLAAFKACYKQDVYMKKIISH